MINIIRDFGEFFKSIYGILITGIAFVGIMYRFGKKLRTYYKDSVEKRNDMRRKIDVIFKELIPNHGSSIKDKIDKLEISLNRNTIITEKILSQMKWVLEHQNFPIFECDDNGLWVWANEYLIRVFQKNIGYFLGKGWKNIIHPDDREKISLHWEQCIKDRIDCDVVFRTVIHDKTIKIKLITNKTETGEYIGSISVLGCDDGPSPSGCNCSLLELCDEIKRHKVK